MDNSDNILYQNIDEPSQNPLTPPPEPKKSIITPKVKFIVFPVFGLLLILLIIYTIFGSKLLSKQTKTGESFLTPTPTLDPNSLPTELDQKLKDIDTYLNDDRRFLPPEIDLKLGL